MPALDNLQEPWQYPHTLLSAVKDIFSQAHLGILDEQSARNYLTKHQHFVEVVLRRGPASKELARLTARGQDIDPSKLDALKAETATDPVAAHRLSGNLRTNTGGDYQTGLMSGLVTSGSTPAYVIGTASSAPSATTLTDSTKAWTTNQWAGYMVVAATITSSPSVLVWGLVLSNTATVLTIDQWNTFATPWGAAGATPANGVVYGIVPGRVPCPVLLLSTDSTTPNDTDSSFTSEVTTNGGGRALGTVTHTAVSGSGTSTNATSYAIANTFAFTGSLTSVQKCYLTNCVVASKASTPFCENTFTPISPISGDSATVTYTLNI